MSSEDGFIFRQCITRNGKRICRPKGQAFRIPVRRVRPADEDTQNSR